MESSSLRAGELLAKNAAYQKRLPAHVNWGSLSVVTYLMHVIILIATEWTGICGAARKLAPEAQHLQAESAELEMRARTP